MRVITIPSEWRNLMVKGHRKKKAARALKKANPDLTHPEARRLVHGQPRATAQPAYNPFNLDTIDSVLEATMIGSEDDLIGQALTNIPNGVGFYVNLDPELDDITIDHVVVFRDWTATHDVHEVYEGGGQVGECRIEAVLEYSATIASADYYAAPASVTWSVSDPTWSSTHILVTGHLDAELIYHFEYSSESVEYFAFQGLTHIDAADPKQLAETSIVPEVPNEIYDKYLHGERPIDLGKPWLKARFEARRRREQTEIETFGRRRPVVPDDSLDPDVLLRDLRLLNYGDGRVARFGREPHLRLFADKLGVKVDQWQTFPPDNRVPAAVDAELNEALKQLRERETGPDTRSA